MEEYQKQTLESQGRLSGGGGGLSKERSGNAMLQPALCPHKLMDRVSKISLIIVSSCFILYLGNTIKRKRSGY